MTQTQIVEKMDKIKTLLADNKIDSALEIVEQMSQDSPDVAAEGHFLCAERYSNKNENERAIECLRKACSLKPDKIKYLGRLAERLFNSGNFESSITYYQRVLEIEQVMWAYVGLGNAFERKGDIDKSIEYFLQAIEVGGGSEETLVGLLSRLINLQKMRGNLNGAVEALQKLMALASDESSRYQLLCNLALSYFLLGQFQEAITHYSDAIDRAPHHSDAYIGLANVFHSLGEVEDEMGVLIKANKIEENTEISERLARLKRQNDIETDIDFPSNNLAADNKVSSNAFFPAPQILPLTTAKLSNIEKLKELRGLSESSPELPEVWCQLSDVAFQLKRWQESFDALKQLSSLQALDSENFYRLGEISENWYKYQEAFYFYLQAYLLVEDSKTIIEKLHFVITKFDDEKNLTIQSAKLLLPLLKKNKRVFYGIMTIIRPYLTTDILGKLDGESLPLMLDLLPFLIDEAEDEQDWTKALFVITVLDGAGCLQLLPDWLAVEIIWMLTLLEKLLPVGTKKEGEKTSEPFDLSSTEICLHKLKALKCYGQAIEFSKDFPLLDGLQLQYKVAWAQKPKTPIATLKDFLSHPESVKKSPHLLFDATWYEERENLFGSDIPLIVHFFRHSTGCYENVSDPNPYFDCKWYRENYLQENEAVHPLLHYLANFKQTRPHRHFYTEYFCDAQGLRDEENPLLFYLEQLASRGADFLTDGCSPSPFFDRKYYLSHNADLIPHVRNKMDPFIHYIGHGAKEGRLAYAWQRYNEVAGHQRLNIETFNKGTVFAIGDGFTFIKGKKAEKAYFAGQKVLASKLPVRPLISVLVPIYQVKPRFLQEMIESVLAQTYENWQLCLVDDASKRYREEIYELLESFSKKDGRIVHRIREKNGHICNTTNDCLLLAEGDYVALLDHDDLLTPDALYEMALAINDNPALDIIYSDEDKIDEWGMLFDPYYKPDWSPHSLWARMYVCHLTVYRKELVNSVGGFRPGFEGSQDYDLLLRCSEKTNQIHHVPRVLYHWRSHAESTAGTSGGDAKDYCADAGYRAVAEAMERRGLKFKTGLIDKKRTAIWVKPEPIGDPLIDIIIPSRNGADLLSTCLESIFENTTYRNFKITVVDNNSDQADFFVLTDFWQKREPSRFQVVRDESPFNFSAINNRAVMKTEGDYLLFLNNDTEVITKDWLEAMLGFAQLEEVGAVGVKLLYPDQTIQHAGVVTGIGGVAGHVMKNFKRRDHGYFSNLEMITNYSAVTAACMMIGREKFNSVGGFTEHLQVAFNDVDFCLKVRGQDLYNVYLPFVELYHYESKSRGYEDNPKKQERFEKEILFMRQRWGSGLDNDPFYSPWLTLDREDMGYRYH